MGQKYDRDTGTIKYTTDGGIQRQVGFQIDPRFKDAAKTLAAWDVTDDNIYFQTKGLRPRYVQVRCGDETATGDLGTGAPGGNDNLVLVKIIIPLISKVDDVLKELSKVDAKVGQAPVKSFHYHGEEMLWSYAQNAYPLTTSSNG